MNREPDGERVAITRGVQGRFMCALSFARSQARAP